MMSDKDNNLLKSDILTVGSELSEKLNAIGVPNTFGKASEGKDNLMSIIRMTINGLDMTIDQIREILRDYYNKSEVNTLLNGKSDTSHNHDSAYASITHNHDSAYADINHNHDDAYASKSHQHDGADVILSNSNDVDSEIVAIEDDITSLNNSMANHTHDNRYYTEAEVRSLINQSIKIVYSGQIDFGTLNANGGNTTKTATISIPSGYSVLTVFPRTWYGCDNFTVVSISGSTVSVRAWNLTEHQHGAWVTIGAICIKNV